MTNDNHPTVGLIVEKHSAAIVRIDSAYRSRAKELTPYLPFLDRHED